MGAGDNALSLKKQAKKVCGPVNSRQILCYFPARLAIARSSATAHEIKTARIV
jgi:hypothetical protein